MSRLLTKPTKWQCAQRRLRSSWASAQSNQSSLTVRRNIGSSATRWANCEDSDQTGRMPRLIWVFAGRTYHFVGFVMTRLILLLILEGTHSYVCPSVCLIYLLMRMYWNHSDLIWGTTWQNQQNECAPSEDSDQPGHPPSLIRVFVVRSMGR